MSSECALLVIVVQLADEQLELLLVVLVACDQLADFAPEVLALVVSLVLVFVGSCFVVEIYELFVYRVLKEAIELVGVLALRVARVRILAAKMLVSVRIYFILAAFSRFSWLASGEELVRRVVPAKECFL